MPKSPPEPTHLVLEQLRLMRAETTARFDKIDERFERVETRLSAIEKEIRGLVDFTCPDPSLRVGEISS